MITKEGWMRKKGSRLNIWGDRYFVLRGQTLYYYVKPTDTEPKGFFTLLSSCKVSEIVSDDYRRKKQYVFRLSWPLPTDASSIATGSVITSDISGETGSHPAHVSSVAELSNASRRRRASNKPDFEESSSSGWFSGWFGNKNNGHANSNHGVHGSDPLTIGQNVNSNANSLSNPLNDHDRHIILALDTYHDAQMWVHALESHIVELQNKRPLSRRSGTDVAAGSGRPLSGISGQDPNHGNISSVSANINLNKRYAPPPGVRIREVEAWIRSTRWEVHGVVDGVRLLRPALAGSGPADEVGKHNKRTLSRNSSSNTVVASIFEAANALQSDGISSSAESRDYIPCLRINVHVNTCAATMLRTILDFPSACWSGSIKSLRVIETLEPYLDVIHVVLDSMILYPTRVAPRDLCLTRYWRQNEDGSFIVCLDSTFHQDCPVQVGYVRADLHAAYVISNPKDALVSENEITALGGTAAANSLDRPPVVAGGAAAMANASTPCEECLVSFIAQLDPRGWVWVKGGYRDRVLENLMMHVIDLKDNVDVSRFAQVVFDPQDYEYVGPKKGKGATSAEAGVGAGVKGGSAADDNTAARPLSTSALSLTPEGERIWMGNTPPSQCPAGMWGEPDAANFKLRDKGYKISQKKVASAPSVFKLIAMDLFDTGSKPLKNICAHPSNRVFQAQRRGEDTWVFVLHILLPGPPFLSFVGYWQADKKVFQEDTPFARIARPFFEGNDNDFRNNRFKLIPKVVSGNFIVKQAVKDTPALLGNKLDQTYYKGDNYFELIVDVGSSSIAKYATGIAMNYCKTLVCDMGMCLQGNEDNELPEVLFGGITAINMDISKAVKLV
jgi:hypothetical protein